MIERIIDKINKNIKENSNIIFIGFKNNKWIGYNKTYLIFKNLKYDEIGEIRYDVFIKNGWKCKTEIHEIKTHSGNYIKYEDAKQKLLEKLNTIKEISNINLKLENFEKCNWIGSGSKITIKNVDSGEIKIVKYSYFIKYGWKNKTGDILRNIFQFKEEEGIKTIKEKLKDLNNKYKTNIEFIKIKTWNGANDKSKVILKEDGDEFEISYRVLIDRAVELHNHTRKDLIYENSCYKIIKSYISSSVEKQYKITLDDKISSLLSRSYIKPDFFIPQLNIIIEYDGIYHYEYIPFLHKYNYKNFIDRVNRDNYLIQYCKENNIRLLRIPWKDNNRLEEVIKAFLVDGKDITTKVEPKLLPAVIIK